MMELLCFVLFFVAIVLLAVCATQQHNLQKRADGHDDLFDDVVIVVKSGAKYRIAADDARSLWGNLGNFLERETPDRGGNRIP